MSRTHGPNAARRRRIRAALAERDGASCFYCAQPFAALTEATIDHLIPHCVLPTWKQASLVLACRPCNRAKADRLPQELLRPAGFGPGLIPVLGAGAHIETRAGAQIEREQAEHVKARGAHFSAHEMSHAAARSDRVRRVCAVRPAGKRRGNPARPYRRFLSALVTAAVVATLTVTYSPSRSEHTP